MSNVGRRGGALGAVFGGGAGGMGTGAAGTLVAPGVGTVAGAAAGARTSESQLSDTGPPPDRGGRREKVD